MNEVARRYAAALFELAQDAGSLDSVRSALQFLKGAIGESAELRDMLSAPVYRLDAKQAALTGLARKMGLPDLVVNFVGTIAGNGRSRDLPGTIAAFEELFMSQRGIKRAVVRTAQPMSPAQRERLEGVIAKSVGGKIEMTEEVEPDLVGGIQLLIGSQLVDATLREKLERLNVAMKGA